RGDRWGERDAIYDMHFDVAVPSEWRGQTLALHLDLAAPVQGWEIATVEGILYLDGKPLHALDRYHREILLGAELTDRDTLEGHVRLWTGIDESEHTLHTTELRLLDEPTDHLYLRMRQILDALNQLPDASPTRLALIAALDEVCHQLDLRDPRSPEAYASYRAALMLLEGRLHDVELPQITWQPHAVAIGHAHIDVAWLWQLRHTRMKAANTFTTALYHMDRYPHFTFLQSTPQLYEFVKEDHPAIYERIKAKVSSGQWEAEGATWVEADTNITGGESLVRQFLLGQRFFRQEFGHTCKVLWLPDVFGYSAALPQLIKAAGADYFITTKISWSDTNRMPVDTFWWEGLDGTRVLTHFITARNAASDRYATYNAEMKPSVPALTWKDYRQQDLNRELLVAYGYGDGGGGPTREWIEAAGNWS
ncbi:MAG TPA: hypothetical protein VKB76_10985, partial [Ktedonobacterales bacterium]|nr:hypothetical protein [Ktedonobacterales bacterium]